MQAVNYDDVLSQLRGFGLIVDGPIKLATGKRSVRCKVEDGDREKRGWYRIYEWINRDGELMLCGSYGIYRGDDPNTQKIELTKRCSDCGREIALKLRECPGCGGKNHKRRELSDDEKAAFKARMAEDKRRQVAEEKARHDRAAKEAEQAWRKCLPVGESAYLVRKCVDGFGVRYTAKGNMVVPMLDTAGRIHGLQIIYPEKREIRGGEPRDKDFWPFGHSKEGKFFLIGGIPEQVLIVAEGYATGATLHMATGQPVAVAFDAGNLLPVALALHRKYPRAHVVLAADDDYLQKCKHCKGWTLVADPVCSHCGEQHEKQNAGITRSEAAALAVGGSVFKPEFADQRPVDRKGPTDFNDLHLAEGLHVVKSLFDSHLSGLQLAARSAPRAVAPAQGGGEYESPAAVSVIGLQAAVERFVPIDDEQGEALFDSWTYTIVARKKMTNLLEAGLRIDDVKKHPYWISRGAYYLHQVGFDPAGTDRHIKLNTWRGWPMKPQRGSCERLLDLLRYLCSNESNAEEVYEWVLGRLAYALQHPGKKLPSAIIMHGPQGTGKSMFFRSIAQIFGDEHPTRNYAVILDQKALQDNFNADWENKLFVLCEEVVNGSDKWQLKNELKELVSGSTLRIRKVFRDGYHQRNRLFLIFLSNEFQPLPLDNDDRRHLVIWTPPKGSYQFYDEVREEIANGGVEALYDYLLSYDLSRFKPTAHPPMTGAKQRLIALSASSDVRFCQEWISGDLGLPVVPCLSTELYSAYLRWCRQNGETRPRPSNQFFGALEHLQGWSKSKTRYFGSENSVKADENRPVVFPPEHAVTAWVRESMGANADYYLRPDMEKKIPAWVGQCIRLFSGAFFEENGRERGAA